MVPNVISVIQRAFEVLDALNCPMVTDVRHIHSITKLPKPTIVRLLETMCALGYVARRAEGGYELTFKVLELSRGFQPVDTHQLLTVARPVLNWLRQQTAGWPSDLVICDTEAMVVLDPGNSARELPITRNRGYRLSIVGSATGRAHLAFCTEEERDNLLRRMIEYPGVYSGCRNSGSLRAILDNVRQRGFATRDCEMGTPTRAMAVPVMADGRVVACLSIVTSAKAITLHQMERSFAPALIQAASGIGQRYVSH